MESTEDVKKYLRNFRGTHTAAMLRNAINTLLKDARKDNESEQASDETQAMVRAIKQVKDILFGETANG